MNKTPPDLTPAEFDIMKVLWEVGRGSVADVRSAHSRQFGSDLAYTTVMTLLGRLATKGAVKVDRTRQPFLYRPAFQRESVVRERLRQFVDSVFDGRAESLVLHLVEQESLSVEEIRRIQRMLRDDERTEAEPGAEAAPEPKGRE